MFYLENDKTSETHSLPEIAANKMSADQVVLMMLNGTIPYRYGATAQSIFENMKNVKFSLFRDKSNNKLLVSPDLLVVTVDNEFEDEYGSVSYDSFQKIVSFRDFNVALEKYGYTLEVQNIEELEPLVNGNEVSVNLVKKENNKKLARM